MTRRSPRSSRSRYDYTPRSSPSDSFSRRSSQDSGFNFNYASIALMGGVLILGMGIGIAFSSSFNSNPQSIDSSIEIDERAPNPALCQQYGASAIVTDMRVFVTLRPFNVFVTQPVMQPGCVLRSNNWALLEQKNLVKREQVKDCKNRMNTFGFVGTLENRNSAEISCIYQNDAAGNLFLNPGEDAPRESENF